MLVTAAVIIMQMQCFEMSSGLSDKTDLILILGQIQMARIQANTELIAVKLINQQENIVDRFRDALFMYVFQADHSISALNMVK